MIRRAMRLRLETLTPAMPDAASCPAAPAPGRASCSLPARLHYDCWSHTSCPRSRGVSFVPCLWAATARRGQ
eukprot:673678-Alexandrium_andersonii.AAC.1